MRDCDGIGIDDECDCQLCARLQASLSQRLHNDQQQHGKENYLEGVSENRVVLKGVWCASVDVVVPSTQIPHASCDNNTFE